MQNENDEACDNYPSPKIAALTLKNEVSDTNYSIIKPKCIYGHWENIHVWLDIVNKIILK